MFRNQSNEVLGIVICFPLLVSTRRNSHSNLFPCGIQFEMEDLSDSSEDGKHYDMTNVLLGFASNEPSGDQTSRLGGAPVSTR